MNPETEINFESKTLDKDQIDCVLYHSPCSDGFGSAFVVWLYYKEKYGLEKANQIEYVPCNHLEPKSQLEESYLEKFRNRNVLMCDIAYRLDQLTRLIDCSRSFCILDHHKTAEKDLANVPANLKIFDMKRSGVGITWDYFFPERLFPEFLAYIQDRDLWTYTLPQTKEFVAYFYEQEFDFYLWEKYLDGKTVLEAIGKGAQWLEHSDIIIKRLTDKAGLIVHQFEEKYYFVAYVNSSEFKSDIGSKLFDRFPMADFSCVWNYDLKSDRTFYSFRSTNDRLDVSRIASKLGGGGHRNASGVILTGCQPLLPLERIDDSGFIPALLKMTNGECTLEGQRESYSLLKVESIKPEWFDPKFVELFKTKLNKHFLIVFQKKIDMVTSDAQIANGYEYTILHNQYAIKDSDRYLSYVACQPNHTLQFESESEFSELVKKFN